MDTLLRLLVNILEEGFLYGIMALGVYFTYSILHFPDLTVDGSLPLGASVTAALIVAGVDPLLAMLAAMLLGMLAGMATGLLHVKLSVSDLLSGILVMTALWSVNLVILGGRAVLPFYGKPTMFTAGLAAILPRALAPRRVLIMLCAVALLIKLLADLFLKTKAGLLLRAAGDNDGYVASLGIDPGKMKILGLMLCNGLAALAGSALAQQAESANVQSGTGAVVMGLASVIIGQSLLGGVRFLRPTTRVLLGSILYKACLVAAMQMGLPTNYLKLLMTVLFVGALVAGRTLDGRRAKHA